MFTYIIHITSKGIKYKHFQPYIFIYIYTYFEYKYHKQYVLYEFLNVLIVTL